MIYLIGGAPRCGKTILSKSIARQKKLSWLSTDAIRPIILNYLSKSQIKIKFPQTTMTTPENKFRFDIYSADAMLKAQLIEAETMWPGIKSLITSLIYREQDYVIEGVHLLPKHLKELTKSELKKNVKIVYLVKKNLTKIIRDFPKNKKEYDWMLPSIMGDAPRLKKAARMVQVKSEYFYREAKKYHLKVINTDDNFEKKLRQASDYLLE
ncbi:MAG: hypothetical protein WCX71_05480 [Candidatus Buchananbacteria bacterium]